jgi:hypothetical protein
MEVNCSELKVQVHHRRLVGLLCPYLAGTCPGKSLVVSMLQKYIADVVVVVVVVDILGVVVLDIAAAVVVLDIVVDTGVAVVVAAEVVVVAEVVGVVEVVVVEIASRAAAEKVCQRKVQMLMTVRVAAAVGGYQHLMSLT